MENNKLDKILEEVNDIKIILARHEILHEKNTEALLYHIKRTDNAETYIKEVHEEVHALENRLDDEINIINNQKSYLKGIFWIISVIIAFILTILQILS